MYRASFEVIHFKHGRGCAHSCLNIVRDSLVEEINKLEEKQEAAWLNEEDDHLEEDIKIALQAEGDLQEKIDDREGKLVRSNGDKEDM